MIRQCLCALFKKRDASDAPFGPAGWAFTVIAFGRLLFALSESHPSLIANNGNWIWPDPTPPPNRRCTSCAIKTAISRCYLSDSHGTDSVLKSTRGNIARRKTLLNARRIKFRPVWISMRFNSSFSRSWRFWHWKFSSQWRLAECVWITEGRKSFQARAEGVVN